MTDDRIPVTLLTGFLGAGKTTLLNALLNDPSAGKIAVVVNEFGEAGLDHDLIESTSEEVVLMSSGCLCCTVRGDLARTITSLAARRLRGELDFDRVVIETTGLADPGPIVQTLSSDPYLLRATRLDGVVTVVDALNGQATLDAHFEAVSQAAMADLIVLSKTDRAAPEDVVLLEARLRGLNSGVRIVLSVRGQGLAGQLWGLHAVRQGADQAAALAWLKTAPARIQAPADPLANLSGLSATPSAPHSAAPHDGRVKTASIVLDKPLTDQVFDGWLDGLIARHGAKLLRVKGIVFLEDLPFPFVFHGVQHVFDAPVPLKDWPAGGTTSRIVVIARDMGAQELQDSLAPLRPA